MNNFIYLSKRPKLVIEHTGGGQLSNCYDFATWKIISSRRLKKETIVGLSNLGFLGIGQEFYIKNQCDGNEPPAGEDLVECVEVDKQGIVVPGVAINPYTGIPYAPSRQPYFEYLCESRCDSGD